MLPFSPTSSFSRENALYLAHAADIAYHRRPAKAAFERLGLTVIPFRCKLTRTRGFLGLAPTHAVLAYRGTEPANLPNWITDAAFALTIKSDYAGRVHQGFSTAINRTWPWISTALEHAHSKGKDLPLFITGHSMGGALAKLTACRLAAMGGGRPAVATYTFGAPRFADTDFCSAYKLPTYRLVNNLDLVPEVPLTGFRKYLPDKPRFTNEKFLARLHRLADRLPAYSHVKTFAYLHPDHTISLDADLTPWSSAALTHALATKGKPFLQGLTDHLISNYIKALQPK